MDRVALAACGEDLEGVSVGGGRSGKVQHSHAVHLSEHEKLVDKVTDLSGRFPHSSGVAGTRGAMSDGERHNIELESRKRLVRQLAQRFNAVARSPEVECCLLAASREINHQLLEELEPQVRAEIEKSIPADLTKLERADILRYF